MISNLNSFSGGNTDEECRRAGDLDRVEESSSPSDARSGRRDAERLGDEGGGFVMLRNREESLEESRSTWSRGDGDGRFSSGDEGLAGGSRVRSKGRNGSSEGGRGRKVEGKRRSGRGRREERSKGGENGQLSGSCHDPLRRVFRLAFTPAALKPSTRRRKETNGRREDKRTCELIWIGTWCEGR
jgi:hypothetical protein